MLLQFPVEILSHISSYLSPRDYYQLVLVNQTYYHQFISLLYQQRDFKDGHQFEHFLHTSRHRKHLRKLELPYFDTFASYLPQLPSIFPYLSFISLVMPNMDLSIDFPQPFQKLNILNMTTFGSLRSSVDMIATMPYLTSLNITFMADIEVTADVLIVLHNLCTHLKHLHIAGSFQEAPAKRESIGAPNKLETIGLESRTSFNDYHHWLKYIANTYPDLKMLKLMQRISKTYDNYPSTFYDWFRLKCSRLVRFEWINIMPDSAFLQGLNDKQCHSQKLKFDSTDLLNYSLSKSSMLGTIACFSSIINLDIRTTAGFTCGSLLLLLGKLCPQLRQLAVEQYDTHSPDKLFIDTVLNLLPYLTSIRFTSMRIYAQSEQQITVPQHPLKQLELKKCFVSNTALELVGTYCPRLSNLCLDQTSHSKIMQIHLPNQNLVKVELDSMYIAGLGLKAIVQLFHLQQKSQCNWYYMDCFEKPAYSRKTVARSFKRLPIKQSENSYLCHQSTDCSKLPVFCDTIDINAQAILEQGHLDFRCESVLSLYINHKRVK